MLGAMLCPSLSSAPWKWDGMGFLGALCFGPAPHSAASLCEWHQEPPARAKGSFN